MNANNVTATIPHRQSHLSLTITRGLSAGEESTVPLPSQQAAPARQGPPRVVNVARTSAVRAVREGLPILGMEQEVMEAVADSDVVLLCGETGCGKTTQVSTETRGVSYAPSRTSNDLAETIRSVVWVASWYEVKMFLCQSLTTAQQSKYVPEDLYIGSKALLCRRAICLTKLLASQPPPNSAFLSSWCMQDSLKIIPNGHSGPPLVPCVFSRDDIALRLRASLLGPRCLNSCTKRVTDPHASPSVLASSA